MTILDKQLETVEGVLPQSHFETRMANGEIKRATELLEQQGRQAESLYDNSNTYSQTLGNNVKDGKNSAMVTLMRLEVG